MLILSDCFARSTVRVSWVPWCGPSWIDSTRSNIWTNWPQTMSVCPDRPRRTWSSSRLYSVPTCWSGCFCTVRLSGFGWGNPVCCHPECCQSLQCKLILLIKSLQELVEILVYFVSESRFCPVFPRCTDCPEWNIITSCTVNYELQDNFEQIINVISKWT